MPKMTFDTYKLEYQCGLSFLILISHWEETEKGTVIGGISHRSMLPCRCIPLALWLMCHQIISFFS
uniref:Uncharacterized protein n=1 Tax=Arundo donax TaxID=35708 RepID=A0A0A9FU38_ARUDO